MRRRVSIVRHVSSVTISRQHRAAGHSDIGSPEVSTRVPLIAARLSRPSRGASDPACWCTQADEGLQGTHYPGTAVHPLRTHRQITSWLDPNTRGRIRGQCKPWSKAVRRESTKLASNDWNRERIRSEGGTSLRAEIEGMRNDTRRRRACKSKGLARCRSKRADDGGRQRDTCARGSRDSGFGCRARACARQEDAWPSNRTCS
eukprot:2835504-Rhodomonas_salina.2